MSKYEQLSAIKPTRFWGQLWNFKGHNFKSWKSLSHPLSSDPVVLYSLCSKVPICRYSQFQMGPLTPAKPKFKYMSRTSRKCQSEFSRLLQTLTWRLQTYSDQLTCEYNLLAGRCLRRAMEVGCIRRLVTNELENIGRTWEQAKQLANNRFRWRAMVDALCLSTGKED